MGLANTFKNVGKSLFNTFNDFVDVVKVEKIVSSSIDSNTGETTTTKETFNNVKAIRRNFNQEEFNSIIISGDVEIKVLAETIAKSIISNDKITLVDGTIFNVIKSEPIPPKNTIVYKLQCRETT